MTARAASPVTRRTRSLSIALRKREEIDSFWCVHLRDGDRAARRAAIIAVWAQANRESALEAAALVLQASVGIHQHGATHSRAMLGRAADLLQLQAEPVIAMRWRLVYAAYELHRMEHGRALEEVLHLLDQPAHEMDGTTRAFAFAMAIAVLEDLRAYDLALDYGRRALAEVSASELPLARARILNNIAGSHYFKGDYRSAVTHCEQALDILMTHGMDNVHVRITYADALLKSGALTEAREQYTKSKKLLQRSPSMTAEGDIFLGLADLALAEHDPVKAFKLAEKAVSAHQSSAKQRLVHTFEVAARAAEAVGKLTLALDYSRRRADAFAELLSNSGLGLIDSARRKLEIAKLQTERNTDARRLADKDIELHLLRATQSLLMANADTDVLTGALNRRSLFERAERLFADHAGHADPAVTPIAVYVIDVDRFKTINDALGHATGDNVLCSLVQALRSMLPTESILGRLGGDEFVVVSRIAAAGAGAAARSWLPQIRSACSSAAGDDVTVTIGVHCTDDRDFRQALEAADQALLSGKRLGRNRVASSKLANLADIEL